MCYVFIINLYYYFSICVFCCLEVYLLSSTSQSELKWTLSKLHQYHNKITFTVDTCCDQITLISRATYLEIFIDCKTNVRKHMPLQSLYPIIYNIIDHGINTVTESLIIHTNLIISLVFHVLFVSSTSCYKLLLNVFMDQMLYLYKNNILSGLIRYNVYGVLAKFNYSIFLGNV